jgi:NADPH:quinone reductase
MRAVVCNEYGPPEALRVVDLADPQPGPGQVVVRVAAAAVNFPDVLIVANKYQISVPTPFTPGSEFAGSVAAVGSGVDGWAIGDQVFGAGLSGAFAELVVTNAASLRRIPPGVDPQVAAATWVAHATAYHSIRSVADVQPGDVVAVTGAAGGVGLAAVEVAALRGATVIAIASTAEKRAVCLEHGAHHAVAPDDELRNALKALAPGGVDVVIDPVGGELSERVLRSMRWGGRFVTVGFAAGDIPRIPLNLVLLKGVIIKGFEIRTFSLHAPELAARDERELLDLLISGRVRPHISATHSLEGAVDALNEVAQRRSTGKVLIVP